MRDFMMTEIEMCEVRSTAVVELRACRAVVADPPLSSRRAGGLFIILFAHDMEMDRIGIRDGTR